MNICANNFFANSPGRENTEKFVYSASTMLDNLLRYPGVRKILCNRTNNIDFDNALANGEITLLCTRRGDLGPSTHKAFGLFFILSMQYAVMRRPGNENTRIPHFLYIDEFSDFVCSQTESMFTMYRKYKVGTIISIQNLDQLNLSKDDKSYRNTVIANCGNKVVFGNNTPEDNEWWSKELGDEKKWRMKYSFDLTKDEYDAKATDIGYRPDKKYPAGKVQSTKFKQCLYKVLNEGGKFDKGIGDLNFLEAKYKEKHDVKKFNFAKFSDKNSSGDTTLKSKKKNPILTSFSEDDNSEEELDPIRTDNSDSVFANTIDDAIIKNSVNNEQQ